MRAAGLAPEEQGWVEGQETLVGGGRVGLSGGQRQRLAIARVHLQRRPLVVLDEPTSALDAVSREVVVRGLVRLASRSVVVVVTHDPAVLSACDFVVHLEQGRLVQFGTLSEVARQDPFVETLLSGTGGSRGVANEETGLNVRLKAQQASAEGLDVQVVVLIGVSAAGVVGVVLALLHGSDYDAWLGAIWTPLLLAATVPFLLAVVRGHERRHFLFRMLLVAATIKLLSSTVRYYTISALYDGSADAVRYARVAAELAPAYRSFTAGPPVSGAIPGTGAMEVISGVVFAFAGSSTLGGFVVFSWLGFLGLLLFWLALRTALPEADPVRYGLLVFFLPSLVFWPSSIGKEAWALFCLGLAAYGLARLAVHLPGGLALVVLGGVGCGLVRPHIAVLVALAGTTGYLLGRPGRRGADGSVVVDDRQDLGPAVRLLAGVVLLVGCYVAVGQAASFFDADEVSGDSVTQVVDDTAEQTNQGGSSFDAPRVDSPLDLPWAAVTVLFRPFPWEAGNVQALVSSAEGLVLLALFWLSRHRLLALPRHLRNPYVLACLAYAVFFVVAFSAFGNFGILVRQRVQLFPFVLVLLCLPDPRAAARDAAGRVRERLPVAGRAGGQAAAP